MQVSVGADPEVFVRNAEGEPVPACGLIPGTKAEPHRVDSGAVQVDGLALEFNARVRRAVRGRQAHRV
jgi:hypothetical protein